MKRHSPRVLYEVAIKKLKSTRFIKDNKPYIFNHYTYDRGVYRFFFVEESAASEKDSCQKELDTIVNTLYHQYVDSYKNTYGLNCFTFDRYEAMAAKEE